VDCRFPYEYEGGHIAGAVNVNTWDALETYFLESPKQGKTVVIFHCEYSAHRAPRLFAFPNKILTIVLSIYAIAIDISTCINIPISIIQKYISFRGDIVGSLHITKNVVNHKIMSLCRMKDIKPPVLEKCAISEKIQN
jgi:hypothetical protein